MGATAQLTVKGFFYDPDGQALEGVSYPNHDDIQESVGAVFEKTIAPELGGLPIAADESGCPVAGTPSAMSRANGTA